MKDPSEGFGIGNLLTWMALGLFLVAGGIAVSFWYLPVIKKNEGMRRQIIALEDKIAYEQEAARQLKSLINALQTDPEVIERMAREKLGYAKPGETVVRFGKASHQD
ncbi:MAG: Cell division protein FtsB [Verrucomicrobia subdivision 3 bacterium]|nr:Cell division protein FtsB [Limisphaerales bacterium]MCS1417764.1 Cell division protein FtsB [Limisphaerales bacterium]